MKAITHALVLLLSFALPTSLSADGRPVVQLVFTFHANTCSNYGHARSDHAEQLARVVAARFGDEFQFVQWRTEKTLDGATPVSTLTVQLRAQDVRSGRQRGVAYYIDYFRDIEINGVKIAAIERPMTYLGSKDALYEWDDPDRPCEDTEFTKKLTVRINDDIRVFRQVIIDNFLRFVPLAQQVPDPDDKHQKALRLGLRYKPLHTGMKSILELNVGGDVKASLNPVTVHDERDRDPFMCARVATFKDYADPTDEQLKNAIASYKGNKYIRLFMTYYELNRNSHLWQPVVERPE